MRFPGEGAALVKVMGAWAPLAGMALCVACMTWAVVQDVRTRTIPRAACHGMAAAGSVAQLITYGAQGWVQGAAFGAVAVIACLGLAAVCKRKTAGGAPESSEALGRGDIRCMAALSLATGPWAPLGAAACALGAGGWAAATLLAGRRGLRDTIAFAPFLALWLLPWLILG